MAPHLGGAPFFEVGQMPGAVFFLAFSNLAFLAAALALGIGRAWLNLDYAVALVLMAFGWYRLGAVVVFLLLWVDLMVLVGQVLPFPRVWDFFYLLSFSLHASAAHFALLILVGVTFLLKWWGMCFWGRKIQRGPALLLLNALIAFYAFFSPVGYGSEGDRFYRVMNGGVVSSQAMTFLRGRSEGFLQLFQEEGNALLPGRVGATAPWFDQLQQGDLGGRLLLIVNESWGVPVNRDIQDALLAPLKDFLVQGNAGDFFYDGVTLGGELRELCKLHPQHYNLSEVERGFEACLPNLLHELGYSTAAMHGAVGLMYDRHRWYPRAGFESAIFFESKIWQRRCYSFPGGCDLDFLSEVKSFFALPGKRFQYWLTLNSHAPYDPRDIRVDIFDCESFLVLGDSESCRNLKLQAQFFHGVGDLLRSESMRGVEVIIVGDHAPVIVGGTERNVFFEEKKVPWVKFRVD